MTSREPVTAPAHLVAGIFAIMLRGVEEAFERGDPEAARILTKAARILAELLERRLDDAEPDGGPERG